MTAVHNISVIVPAYENAGELARCLQSLELSEMRGECEIIVIDDCSPEEGPAIEQAALRYGARFYRQQENAGPGMARNLGAKKAKGDILVFIDSDCVAPPDWISRLVNPLREGLCFSTTSCYCGPVSPNWITTFQDEDYRYRMPLRECDISFVNSCNFAIKQNVFQDLGGFPEQRISEDMVFGLMLAEKGMPTRFLPAAGVLHGYYGSILSYLKQRYSFAFNTVVSYLERKRGRPKKPCAGVTSFNPFRTAAGMFFIFTAVVSFMLAGISALTGYGDPAVFIFYGFAGMFLETVVHSRFLLFLINRQGVIRSISYVFLFYLIDLAYVCGVVSALIRSLARQCGL